MTDTPDSNKTLKTEVNKQIKKDLAAHAVETTARSALDSITSPTRTRARQTAFDQLRDIPILGSIVSLFHTASYIPGVEENAKKLSKKITNSPKSKKKGEQIT